MRRGELAVMGILKNDHFLRKSVDVIHHNDQVAELEPIGNRQELEATFRTNLTNAELVSLCRNVPIMRFA